MLDARIRPGVRREGTDTIVRMRRVITVAVLGGALALPSMVRGVGADDVSAATTGFVGGWGINVNGELGPLGGRYTCCGIDPSPIPVQGVDSAIAVAAGDAHSLALRSDDTVWAWGDDTSGQLGNGKTSGSAARPAKVAGLDHVFAIAAGSNYSLAAKFDGTVWGWGGNTYGNLGDGSTTPRSIPVQVSGLTGVTKIAAASALSVALKSDGTVWAWGFNDSGQLGNGTRMDSHVPVQVQGLSGMVAISSAGEHALAVGSNGAVWIWGDLSNGTGPYTLTPKVVSGLTNVVAVASAGTEDLALKADGSVWRWIGDGTGGADHVPSQVSGLSGIAAIAASGGHMLALGKDGKVWGWGANRQGQAGSGKATLTGCRCVPKPVQVPRVQGAKAIATGTYHSLAVTAAPIVPQKPPAPKICLRVVRGALLTGDSLSSLKVSRVPSGRGRVFAIDDGSYDPSTGYQDCSGAVTAIGAAGRVQWTAPVRLLGDAVVDDAAGRVFVVSLGDQRTNTPSSVIMIDMRTGKKLKSIPVGQGPVALGVDERTYRLFAVTGRTVRMIAVTRGAVLRTEQLPTTSSAVTVDQRAGRVYLVGALVTTLDSGTGDVVWAEQAPAGALSGVGVDEQTGRLFVTLSGDATSHPISSAHGTVDMFDARTGRLLHRFDMGAYVALANLVVDEPAKRVLITEETTTSSRTEVRDASTGTLLRLLPMIVRGASVDPRSGWIYCLTSARQTNVVSILNPNGWRTVRTVKIGTEIAFILRDRPAGRVFLIDVRGNRNTAVRSFIA
jgi:Regulator of chromosome condensation (RCC1) repeat